MMLIQKYYENRELNFWNEQTSRGSDLKKVRIITDDGSSEILDILSKDDRENIQFIEIDNQNHFETMPSETIKKLIDHLKSNYQNVSNFQTKEGFSYTNVSLTVLFQRNHLNEMIKTLDCSEEDKAIFETFVGRVYETTKITLTQKQ